MVRLGVEGRGIRHLFALSCLAARRAAAPPPPADSAAAAAGTPAAAAAEAVPALFRCEAWRRVRPASNKRIPAPLPHTHNTHPAIPRRAALTRGGFSAQSDRRSSISSITDAQTAPHPPV
jgi:hypothetical protein